MEEERYHYTSCLDSDDIQLIEEKTINTKICRRCGTQFIPKDNSGTNAYSFRCDKCMSSTKEFLKDIIYSCNIM